LGALLLLVLAAPPILSATPAEPNLCGACHAMAPWHDSYLTNKHAGQITCSDCHTPPGLRGLLTKYGDGSRHLLAQAAGVNPEEIRISERGMEVVLDNCITCHAATEHAANPDSRYCISCHADQPHGQ
jgi:cytochrome c nitrite reductase small subunit